VSPEKGAQSTKSREYH